VCLQAAGDLSKDEEDALKKSLAMNRMTASKVAEEQASQAEKISVYEKAFRKIKDATGVADVNEVIQKIVSQEDTQAHLRELSAENQVSGRKGVCGHACRRQSLPCLVLPWLTTVLFFRRKSKR
jgi:hypothetical protein